MKSFSLVAKKIACLVFASMILVTCVSNNLSAVKAADSTGNVVAAAEKVVYGGGSGTESDP